MAVRKSMEEELVVTGNRDNWLNKCEKALSTQGFTKIDINNTLYQINANYKKFSTWGEIQITLEPNSNDTKIKLKTTANVDNAFALFKSPNKKIMDAFKGGL